MEKVEIRALRPEEFPGLLDFWSGRHAATKEDLQSDYKNDPYYKPEHSRVVIVDGKIVSNVRIYQRPMRVGSTPVRNGGIGNVYTDPDFRGRGYATALLQDAFGYMKEHDFDLSMILGIRLYGRVGWAIFPQDLFTIKIVRGRFPHKAGHTAL